MTTAVTAPAKYRRKPPPAVEAMRWDGTAEGATPIIEWVLGDGGNATYRCDFLDKDGQCNGREADHSLVVIDETGNTRAANAGWWVVRESKANFRLCLNSIFEANYEAAS